MGGGVYLLAHLLVVPTCWERRTTCWVTMWVPGPRVLDLQRPPPFREGRDLAHSVPACSKGAECVPGAGGGGGLFRVSHPFDPASVGGGGGGKQKVCCPVSWSPTGNQPTACTLALWWLKFGLTEPRRGRGGSGKGA